MADRNVNIRLATQNADKAIADLRAFGREGEAAFKRLVAANRDFVVSSRGFGAAGQNVSRFERQSRAALGNVAQQVQDVAVQFQSGTSAAVIFAQQGPQILGAFGPVGALMGAVAGVTAVAAGAMLGFGESADKATQLTDLFSKTLADNSSELRRNIELIVEADEATRRFAAGRAREAQADLLKGLGSGVVFGGPLDQAAKDAAAQAAAAAALLTPEQIAAQGFAPIEAGARLREDIPQRLLAALKTGKGHGEIFAEAERLGISAKASAAIQQIADAADVYAANQALIEAAETGRAPGRLPGETQSPFVKFAEGLDSKFGQSANTAAEKIAAVNAELAETLKKIDEFRKKGTDEGELKRAEQTARATAAREIAGIEEVERKRQAAESRRDIAAQKRSGQEARKIAEVEAEVAGMRRLEAALDESVDKYRLVENQLRAEREARALGTEATKDEIAAMTAAVLERERIKDAIAAEIAARKENEKLQLDEIDRFNKQSADRVEQLISEDSRDQRQEVQQLQRNLQTNVASAIERGFEDGFGSVDDLVDQFGSLLKSTVATALADSLITEGLAKSISGALGTQLGQIAPSLAGTRAGSVTVGGAAAGGLGAAFGGYAVGQQFAGNRPLGTLAGAASGAGIGFVVGGPIGAGIGAGIGGLAGFFGAGSTGGTRNNNFQAGFDPLTGRPVEFQNTRPDPQNQGIVAGVVAELATLREGLRSTGIVFGDIGDLVIQAGNKSGLTLNGERFGSQSALTEAALRQLLSGAEGLSANQNRALANTQATSAAGILGDLDFARQLDDLREGGGALGQQLRDNERQFDALRARAEELGLATRDLDKAQAQDLATIRQNVEAQLGLVDPLTVAIRGIGSAFAEAIDNAERLGLSERRLIDARDKQIKAAQDAQRAQFDARQADIAGRAQALFGFLPALQNFGNDNAANGIGLGTDTSRFLAQRNQYERVLRQARGGDTEALNQITGIAQQLIGSGQELYASGPRQAALEGRIAADIQALADRFGQLQQDRFGDLIDAQERTVQQQTAALVTELKESRREYAAGMKAVEAAIREIRNLDRRRSAAG